MTRKKVIKAHCSSVTPKKKQKAEALPAVIDPEDKERQALVTQLEGDLPYEKTLYINEAKRYLKRSIEDVLTCGKLLLVIQAKEGYGEFIKIIESEIGIPHTTAYRFMNAALKAEAHPAINFSHVGNLTKVYALLEAPEEELEKFEQMGLFAGLTKDEIDLMTASQLRAEVRRLKEGKESKEVADLKSEIKVQRAQLDEYDRRYHKGRDNWLDANRHALLDRADNFCKELRIIALHDNAKDNEEAREFFISVLKRVSQQVNDIDRDYKAKTGLSFAGE